MSASRHVIVFAKKPQLGRVKTRLAAHIGEPQALEFYRRTLLTLLARLSSGGDWRCWISLTPDTAVTEPPFWPAEFEPLPQGDGDLGRRMARSIEALPGGPVLLVGADIPALQNHHLEAGFEALENHDTVFGPAADGGYWLVGSNRTFATADLFENVRWSTDRALADTLANVNTLGKTAARLATLEDIDDDKAYQKWLTNALSGAA